MYQKHVRTQELSNTALSISHLRNRANYDHQASSYIDWQAENSRLE